MVAIQDWSEKRKIDEKEAHNQKLQLQKCIQERIELNKQIEIKEKAYNEDLDKMRRELDHLKEVIKEKKQNKDGNILLQPKLYFIIEQEIAKLKESEHIFWENLKQIKEVYGQCYEQFQMGNEDKQSKMISRVDLVSEIEELEEIIQNMKNYK